MAGSGFDPRKHRKLCSNLQGNILKGHGRDHTAHLFLRFRAHAVARKFIRDFARAEITSAWRQLEQRARFQRSGENEDSDPFASFMLSASGYRFLGVPGRQLPRDRRFRGGMKASATALGDRPDTWEEAYAGAVHAMVLLANDDKERLMAKEAEVRAKAAAAALVLAVELGDAHRDSHDHVIEHFGYVDGASQPLFLEEDIAWTRAAMGTHEYDPAAPLTTVLVRESAGDPAVSYGSYLVFRKLEQNVKAFKAKERELARVLGFDGETQERAGALAVGRFEDGTPVRLQSADGTHSPVLNDFSYEGDARGIRCPLQAHIRKVNSRERTAKERAQRIARRGITYGRREPDDEPEKGVGLLFMCFQADIARQFEALQKRANSAHGGRDPLIGQRPAGAQKWPVSWGEPRTAWKPYDFGDVVTMKGGEYFFAPSIAFLKSL